MYGSNISNNQPFRGSLRLLIEAIVGAVIGVLLAIGGGYLGPVFVRGYENGWNDLAASVVGALLGYIIGAPLGVIVTARLLKQQGVVWRALLGSIFGGVVVMLLAGPLRLNQQSWLLMTVFAAAVLVGALWGFQKRAKQ